MKLRPWFFGAFALVGLACSSNEASPDDDDEDTESVAECTKQPENVRIQYCDIEESNALFACEDGSPPPSENCTAAVEDNSYCCPVARTEPTDSDDDDDSDDDVVYPKGDTGWKVGDVIPNVSMEGYAADSSKQTTISLADFYDAKGETVLMIVAGTLWDLGTKQTLQVAAKSKAEHFETLFVLGQGPAPEAAAILEDVTTWRAQYPWAAHGLDANFKLFKPAFDLEAVPLVMFIDTSTMKICETGVGALSDATALEKSLEKCRP